MHDTTTNLEPSHVEEELKNCEERNNEIDAVAIVFLHWIQKLTTEQATNEERVDG